MLEGLDLDAWRGVVKDIIFEEVQGDRINVWWIGRRIEDLFG